MRAYTISSDDYSTIWIELEKAAGRGFSYPVLDRWLSIFHGLTAAGDDLDEDYHYPFVVRDEGKLMFSLLKYGDKFGVDSDN